MYFKEIFKIFSPAGVQFIFVWHLQPPTEFPATPFMGQVHLVVFKFQQTIIRGIYKRALACELAFPNPEGRTALQMHTGPK